MSHMMSLMRRNEILLMRTRLWWSHPIKKKAIPCLYTELRLFLFSPWYLVKVATSYRQKKKILTKYSLETFGNLNGLENKLYGFDYRGVSLQEISREGALAYLVNLKETVTVLGIAIIIQNTRSVPSHSVPTSRKDLEKDTFEQSMASRAMAFTKCVRKCGVKT